VVSAIHLARGVLGSGTWVGLCCLVPQTSRQSFLSAARELHALKNLDFSGKAGDNDCNLGDVCGAVEERNMAAERPVAKLELFAAAAT
jgi:hypothetical protein